MADNELAELETFVCDKLKSIAAVTTAVEGKIFNRVVGRVSNFPVLVFSVIPLEDNFGQSSISIQSRFLIDIKIVSLHAPEAAAEIAVAAIKSNFKSITAAVAGDSVVSIRHDRAISQTEKDSGNLDNIYFHRGGTFKAWMSPRP